MDLSEFETSLVYRVSSAQSGPHSEIMSQTSRKTKSPDSSTLISASQDFSCIIILSKLFLKFVACFFLVDEVKGRKWTDEGIRKRKDENRKKKIEVERKQESS